MKFIGFIFRHIIPIGILATLGLVIFSMATPEPTSRIEGIGVDLTASPPITLEAVEAQLNAIQQAGAEYVLVKVDWTLIEITQDTYNWSNTVPLDVIFSAAQSRGLKSVAVVTGFPIYLSASTSLDQKTVGERWEKFIQAAVDHFGEQVNYWQIGDQINSNSMDVSARADPSFYAKMLRAAGKIIRRADSNDSVWMGSLVSATAQNCAVNPLTFLLEVNGAGAWNSADVITYQPRRGAATPENPSTNTVNQGCVSSLPANPASITAEVASLQDLARQLGGKTVYITGLTWNATELTALQANRSIDSNTLQSDLLVRGSTMLIGSGATSLVFWQVDPLSQPIAMTSLANLNMLMDHALPLGQIQGQTGNVQEYRFQKSSAINVLAWRSLDGDTPQPVSISSLSSGSLTAFAADTPSLEAAYGTPIQVDEVGGILVMLNERPVIFTGKNGGWDDQIKATASEQLDLWKIDIRAGAAKLLNRGKTAFLGWLDELFVKAKDSAIDWGEEQIKNLLN